MADKTILTPGYQEPETNVPEISAQSVQYLEKDNYLSEFETDEEKARVRDVLGVPSLDDIPELAELYKYISDKITGTISLYNLDELKESVVDLQNNSEDYVKKDGSTPFENPQKGVSPITDNDLTTKGYVTNQLKQYLNLEDIPSKIFDEIETKLKKYVLTKDLKIQLENFYTKKEIDNNKSIVRTDGSTPFTQPQQGVKPQRNYHLATKGYVDDKITEHLIDPDPHNFSTILENRLAYYIKKKDVYDKSQTYSRAQIDALVYKLVNDAIGSSIQEYVDSIEDKFDYISKQNYVKQDGSTPFKAPQAGVEAEADDEFTTLGQVTTLIEGLKESVETQITNKECEWKTSGPVLGSAGLVEQGTEFAKTLTLQEIMDAIFYGKGISIVSDEIVPIKQKANITVCVQGSIASFEYGELYQNGELIHTFNKDDFKDSMCITVESDPIVENTEFVFEAHYINDATHSVSCFTKLAMPIFVGLIPEWKMGTTVTHQYLYQLYKQDPTNNQFYDKEEKLARLDHKYSYINSEKMKIFVALPVDYPDLFQMVTPSQQFDADSFTKIDAIAFDIPGEEKHLTYKLYIYKEAQVIITNPVTFNFLTDHEQQD